MVLEHLDDNRLLVIRRDRHLVILTVVISLGFYRPVEPEVQHPELSPGPDRPPTIWIRIIAFDREDLLPRGGSFRPYPTGLESLDRHVASKRGGRRGRGNGKEKGRRKVQTGPVEGGITVTLRRGAP
jgi:hypothetical protein